MHKKVHKIWDVHIGQLKSKEIKEMMKQKRINRLSLYKNAVTVIVAELELVQNAFFTDPNDQSAWFYHMWLLGASKPPLGICHLHIMRKDLSLYVLLTQAVKVYNDNYCY